MKKRRSLDVLFIFVLFAGIYAGLIKPTPVEAKETVPTLIVKDGSKAVYYGLKSIVLKGKPGYFSGTSNTNKARFSIYRNGDLVATQDFTYTYADMSEYISYTYLPGKNGNYRVKFCHLSWNSAISAWDEDYIKTAEFSVVKKTAAKKSTPQFTVRTVSSGSIEISGLDPTALTRIYRASSKKGKYRLIKTVNESSFIDTPMRAGAYYYKIQVTVQSGKKLYSTKRTKAVAAYLGAPSKPVIKSISVKAGKIIIKWKKNSDYDNGLHFMVRVARDSKLTVDDRWGGLFIGSVDDQYRMEVPKYNFGEGDTWYFYIWANRLNSETQEYSMSKPYKYKIPK